MKTSHCFAMLLTAAALVAPLSAVQAQAARSQPVIGEKLDNGLGDLPPYAQWDDKTGRMPMRHRVLGESIDDGLGELPHYSKWLDRTGRDPMGHSELSAQLSKR
ncbi:MAG: hypothetical protein U1E89_12770 [Burkholderiaceae bacterium]